MNAGPVVTSLQQHWQGCRPLLLLAATDTAAVPGISAAGLTPASRLLTPAADAELMLLGVAGDRRHALPPLPAGVSPAVITHVALRELGLLDRSLVVDLGCAVAPAVRHLRLPAGEGRGAAACVSTGAAMAAARVRALLQRGQRWAQHWPANEPLVLAECVPGGTTTALAVLQGLGIEAGGLVSGSLRQPAHDLKGALVARGLDQAGIRAPASPASVLAAVGDPMQALAAGLVQCLALRQQPVLLAGGSQMAAVLALALALTPQNQRATLASWTLIATTRWVVGDGSSDLPQLLRLIGERWQVKVNLQVATLAFDGCSQAGLRDYERGFVKEGVGAGGLATLWELAGEDPRQLARRCDQECGA